jgi:hypothetical protein
VQEAEGYVEVEYAIAFDNEWQEPPLDAPNDVIEVRVSIENWLSQASSPEEITQINDLLSKKSPVLLSAKQKEALKKIGVLTMEVKDSVFFSGVTDGFKIESPVFIRGNHLELSADAVPRAFLPSISGGASAINNLGSGREEMVEAILAPENPLTARVMANRIWHHLFGRGIVESVDNFGLQGKLPTHPELLDFLAIQFQKEGWSIKQLIRAIVLSETFQRSTAAAEGVVEKDPENLFLARYPVRRLEAEAIRDAILAASGNLDTSAYGPSVKVHLTGFMQGRGRPGTSGPIDGDGRRSIYLEVRRNFLPHVLQTFDFPTPFTAFGKRDVTNVPSQSLLLMNDPFVIHQAEIMADHLISTNAQPVDDRVRRIYQLLFSRNPTTEEQASARAFIQEWQKEVGFSDTEVLESAAVWKEYCHALFNVKEFIYLM